MEIDAKDLGALEKALNDAAGKASVLWTTFVTFELYLAIAFGSVKHRDLFLENPVKLPILNVDLPLVVFFAVAPAILVIFHFYVFLQLYGLATKAREYNALLQEQAHAESDRQRVRQRLDTFFVLQFLAGPKEQRGHFQGFSLRLIAWITLVGAPILILLQAQVTFLAYHLAPITWVQRLLLLVDLVVIWGFWDRIRSQDDPILGQMLSRVWPVVGVGLSIAAFGFSAFVATFPGEWVDEPFTADSRPDSASLHELLFAGAVDEVTGQPGSFFSNRLVLTDQAFVDSEKLEKVEISRAFRGRDLRGAVLNRADLRQADFTGARLDGAKLIGAKLEKAQFGCAPRGAAPADAQSEDGCTWLHGASLGGARLQGAKLEKALLQGAWLYGAQLQGAWLHEAHLEGAKLPEADLQGVSLAGTQLQGAQLAGAKLQGAWLNGAKLQGASLYGAHLEGASLDDLYLQGASLARAQLQGASLAGARLQGASLDNADIWRVKGMRDADAMSFRAPNCTKRPWEKSEDQTDHIAYKRWRDKILHMIPEGDPKSEAGQRLATLDPQLQDVTNCPREGAADAKQLAEYLVTLACSADAAPHVARGLMQNGRIAATGVEAATVVDRLRRGKADVQTCPGVKGFTDEDWAELDKVVASVPAPR
jgi:uncharacterized protein YjbI with pentapeptide repeats